MYIVGYVWGDYGNITEDFDYFDNAPHQSNYGGGKSDGFLAKFDPQGTLIWATLFGGEKTDIIEGITIDRANNIYIMGFTDSETGISTPYAHQVQKEGTINIFVSKLNPMGIIEWSTYFGDENTDDESLATFANSNFLNSDTGGNYIIHDGESNLYVTSSLGYTTTIATVPPTDGLGLGHNFIGKFIDEGDFVWNTFNGINFSEIAGICSCYNALYLTGYVQSLPNSQYPENDTYFGSPNAYQPSANSIIFDSFLAKFDNNGTRLWGT